MKLSALFLLLPIVAFCAPVRPLPPPEFADTEVSTNIPFEVSFDDNLGQTVFVTSGHTERTFLLKRSKLDEEWNLVKVTRRGRGDIGEITFVNGYRPGCVLEVR